MTWPCRSRKIRIVRYPYRGYCPANIRLAGRTAASLAISRDTYVSVDRATESKAHARRLTGHAQRRRRPAAGARVRLPLFSGDLLEDVDVEIAVGHHLLKPTVFLLELTEALDVRRFQRPEPLPPRVDGLITDAVLLRHVG